MVVTTDPLSIIPAIGMANSAWLSVHEVASDIATSAVAAQFAVLDYNIPPSLPSGDFEAYAKAVSEECKRMGISIVAGHSGRYPGADFTVVGGGTMMAVSEETRYVTPRMIQGGEDLIMTKSAAIEATAALALSFPETTERRVGTKTAKKAASYIRKCSVVDDALAASSVGVRTEGVAGMHDATEGGILGGLYELAAASGKTLVINLDRVRVSAECRAVCEAYGIDPLTTVSEGALIVACVKEKTKKVLERLAAKNIEGSVIGAVGGTGARLLVSVGRTRKVYKPPEADPYWEVYSRGVKDSWR